MRLAQRVLRQKPGSCRRIEKCHVSSIGEDATYQRIAALFRLGGWRDTASETRVARLCDQLITRCSVLRIFLASVASTADFDDSISAAVRAQNTFAKVWEQWALVWAT